MLMADDNLADDDHIPALGIKDDPLVAVSTLRLLTGDWIVTWY